MHAGSEDASRDTSVHREDHEAAASMPSLETMSDSGSSFENMSFCSSDVGYVRFVNVLFMIQILMWFFAQGSLLPLCPLYRASGLLALQLIRTMIFHPTDLL